MDEHNVELLRRALKAGPRTFVREMAMFVRNKLCGATHLVFEMRKQDHVSVGEGGDDSISLLAYETWDEVPEQMKKAIARDLHDQYWGKEQWFQLGWRFWIGTSEGNLAIVSWTREVGQCDDFFFPVPPDSALIWQTVTVPAFRGRGLCSTVFKRLADILFERGFARVYVSCRDYNISSRRAIEKAGFCHIGRGFVRKKTGRGIWYPVVRPFTQG